ncbi:SGNH/GDSL hydrolase family protein [Paenibacillus sp. BC26]|uniref:SGNH/GDSL hydrolase family protein n=1 Tax=Paenibacillus sp. BC26 TaxID=1881032 RepID=UPI0008EADC4A|nr:SGNH/GDSL hydrolase family protein [Paenibacillus sp. BC26]SFS60273.1 Lysophospholipase L1 [Paenibacillus sp. BC26]
MNNIDQYCTAREGLPRFRKKLSLNEPVTVAFLGGSITEGYGASDPDRSSWRALTEQYLQTAYPSIEWTFINAGVGGTNSTLGAHRLQAHVKSEQDIDLLFIEFAVNDSQHREHTAEGREETIRGMEGIVRQSRRLLPQADLVFLYSADENNLKEKEPFFISAHEEVAARYGLPSVSFFARVRDWLWAGGGTWEQLAPDRTHPNDDGYAFYADLLLAFLEAALEENTIGTMNEVSFDLPVPLLEGSYEQGAMRNISAAYDVKLLLKQGRPDNMVNWRYAADHLASDSQEAAFSFDANGHGAGLLLICGPDSGMLEFSINGGPFRLVNPFDEWCPLFQRPVPVQLAVHAQAEPMRIMVRNTAQKDERSTGNWLRVLALLEH